MYENEGDINGSNGTYEEAAGTLLQKCEQINNLGINVNAAFTPSVNVLAAANKARGMLYFIKSSFTSLIFVPLYCALVRPHPEYAIQANCPYLKKDINHLERIQGAATWWVKGRKGLTYDFKPLNYSPLEKRRLRSDLVLTHKILYNHIDLDATQLLKFSRRPGIRRSSIRLLSQTGRTRRRRNSFACRVVNSWNRLPLSITSVTEQRKFKQLFDSYVYS